MPTATNTYWYIITVIINAYNENSVVCTQYLSFVIPLRKVFSLMLVFCENCALVDTKGCKRGAKGVEVCAVRVHLPYVFVSVHPLFSRPGSALETTACVGYFLIDTSTHILFVLGYTLG